MNTVEIEYLNGETKKLLVPPIWSLLVADLGSARRVVIDREGEGEVYWRGEEGAWYGIREGVVGTTFLPDRHLANIVRDALGAVVVLVTKVQRRRTNTIRVWLYERDLLASVEVRVTHRGTKIVASTTAKGKRYAHLVVGLGEELLNNTDKSAAEIQDLCYNFGGW